MLNQATPDVKLMFVTLFTRELILNTKKRLEEEKIFMKREKEKEIGKELQEIAGPIEKIKIEDKETKEEPINFSPKEKNLERLREKLSLPMERRLNHLQRKIPPRHALSSFLRKKPVNLNEPQVMQVPKGEKTKTIEIEIPKLSDEYLSSQTEPEIDLGKVSSLLKDKQVTLIECPGAKKLVAVKKSGIMKITKISLSEEEIKNIIQNFSQKAKIPVVGGILKARAGNLSISAVVSEFVGSRFIINRFTAYSFIDRNNEFRKGHKF